MNKIKVKLRVNTKIDNVLQSKVEQSQPEEVKKRSRPDRAKKLNDRKTRNETVVKSCLLKYIQGDNDIKKRNNYCYQKQS